jgi:hypothetical protein
MSLTQFAILNAVAKDKPLMLSDGFGLHLLVQPNGSKLWRFRYRFGGRANMLTFGAFPTVSLAAARSKRDDARKLLADGADPSTKRKLDKIAAATNAQNTFGAVAAEYLAHMEGNGASESTLSKNRWMLEDLAAPLANRPIAEIVAAEILIVLNRNGHEGLKDVSRALHPVHPLPEMFAFQIGRCTSQLLRAVPALRRARSLPLMGCKKPLEYARRPLMPL